MSDGLWLGLLALLIGRLVMLSASRTGEKHRILESRTAWGAFVRNASLLPVFDVRVFFHFVQERSGNRVDGRGLGWYPVDRGGPVEPLRVVPPGDDRFVEIPETIKNQVDQCDAQTCVVAIHFTDAAGVRWIRDGRGELIDVSVEGALARTEANRRAEKRAPSEQPSQAPTTDAS